MKRPEKDNLGYGLSYTQYGNWDEKDIVFKGTIFPKNGKWDNMEEDLFIEIEKLYSGLYEMFIIFETVNAINEKSKKINHSFFFFVKENIPKQ
ncbi:MAG: hypothetical protein JXR58_03190 [Bacteroidales bacterium]|nr:hypothetical protein [Bacteroidales bacterium]